MKTLERGVELDQAKLDAFLHRVVGDFGAALSHGLGYVGQECGLYEAMADGTPVNSEELAERTQTQERYVREWLINQAAGGYVEYDPQTQRYRLPAEQAEALTNELSPHYVGGGFYSIKALLQSSGRIAKAFKQGGGVAWGEHDPDLFHGVDRFFRPGYIAHLVKEWIPATRNAEAKLKAGAVVADVGCGFGSSTLIMAEAYPNSRFYGFDFHADSIAGAQEAARRAGLSDRVTFQTLDAAAIPDRQYDLVTFFDCVHDMGDPVGAARHIRTTLAPTGSLLLVEPMAGETVEQNINPIGRVFSASSTMACMPNSLAVNGPALGALVTDEKLAQTFREAGYTDFQRITETPFNRVFEVRP